MLEYIVLGVSVSASLLVGFFVVTQDMRNRINQVYGLLTLFFVLLAVANIFSLKDEFDRLLFARLVIASSTAIVYLLYLLIRALSTHASMFDAKRVYLGVLTLFVFVLDLSVLVFSDFLGTSPAVGPLVFVYFLHFITFTALSAIELYAGIGRSLGRRRQQLRPILWGLLPALLLAPLTTFILPVVFGWTNLVVLTPVYSLILVVSFGYAIVRHGLFDVKLAAVRSAAYILSLLSLAGIYYAVAYFVSVFVFRGDVSNSFSLSPLNILLALGLAFVFQPIKAFFDRATDKIFFRDRYDTDDFHQRFSEALTSTTDLRTLLQRVAAEVSTTLKAEQAFLHVQYNHSHRVSAGTRGRTLLPQADTQAISSYITSHDDSILVTDLLDEEDKIHRLLVSHRIAILMPLMRKSTVLGFLALGDHQAGKYTDRDLKVLRSIADELVIAIQNSLSVQEVRDLNATLQQRVDAATKELKASNARLRHLDATKDEFLSMASHQLRTPLTSVKGYLSMVLEGDAGKITGTQRKLLEEAYTSSERMVHLIHDFLNVSRLQTGKFTLEQHPVDVVALIQGEVRALERVAESRDMKLAIEVKGDIPIMSVDESKLQQVVMNYIDNALYYSRPESPVVRIVLQCTDDAVELRVIDGGIGVPKAEQQRLFEKFFRAGNARTQRPDGTGVGIYLAKKVVAAHGGEIIFESKEGQGSTFGFWLPLSLAVENSEPAA